MPSSGSGVPSPVVRPLFPDHDFICSRALHLSFIINRSLEKAKIFADMASPSFLANCIGQEPA